MESPLSGFTLFCKQLHLFRILLPEQVENHRSKIQNTDSSCHVFLRCESLAFILGHTLKSPGRVTAQLAICRWGALGFGGSDATASAPYLPAMEQLPPPPPRGSGGPPPTHFHQFQPKACALARVTGCPGDRPRSPAGIRRSHQSPNFVLNGSTSREGPMASEEGSGCCWTSEGRPAWG